MFALLAGWKGYAAAGLMAVLLLAGVYQAGVNAERKRGEAAQLRVELQTIEADRALAEKALIAARDDAATLEAEAKRNQEALDALNAQLAAGEDHLPASGADLDRLYP